MPAGSRDESARAVTLKYRGRYFWIGRPCFVRSLSLKLATSAGMTSESFTNCLVSGPVSGR